jgi:ATP-dependent DNA helicase DinG
VEITWESAGQTMRSMLERVRDFYQSAQTLPRLPDQVYDALDTLGNLYRRLDEAQEQIAGFASKSDPEYVYWAEITPNSNQIALEVAPLHIGGLMEKNLWHEKASVILTSATLTTNTGFDYLRNRLNADEAEEYTVGSPFDYETSALLYLVNDIPEPVDRSNYQRMLDQILMRTAQATGGRMLVLFTSYAQLKLTAKTIGPYLEENGIYVYEQGKGASPNVLLENFRTAEKAVLLGTRSFWEGVDIPGEALSVLVITRLPFEVPSDPVIASRSEQFEDPFHEYNLPEAVLRFRQGFGRLIRTQSDRGVVVVLDKRILSKTYGKAFVEALPKCTLKVDSAINLPKAAARWLNL